MRNLEMARYVKLSNIDHSNDQYSSTHCKNGNLYATLTQIYISYRTLIMGTQILWEGS